jgi:hypothetical protein
MPNPTIDLQRDCELFVDFDTDYFDSQRNKILDRSGNGRNPEAFGGPTLGTNGPDNFEAASFDGSDDRFQSRQILTSDPLDSFSAFTLALARPVGQRAVLWSQLRPTFRLGTNGDRFELFVLEDGQGPANVSSVRPEKNEFFSVYLQYNSNQEQITSILNGGDEIITRSIKLGLDNEEYTIGSRSKFDDQPWNGNIAFHGFWSRTLSDAEIEYLNRLTEPRRAQL